MFVCVCACADVVGAGHLPLLPDGLLSGGGPLLLQLPENVPLDHQRLPTVSLLLLQGSFNHYLHSSPIKALKNTSLNVPGVCARVCF